MSRLVGYKKIDIAIKACNQLNLPLKIIGDGMEKHKLAKLAGPTIQFLGNLTERELIHYYQNCRALLYTQEEDLGLTAVEAQACGRPVIAFGRGGALEIIKPGTTGEFFGEQTVHALISAIKLFLTKQYNALLCRKQAEQFDVNRFKVAFAKVVESSYDNFRQMRG